MPAPLTAWQLATSRIGLPLIVAGGLILFYEGVPLGPLRWIPVVGPRLEILTDGRVDAARKEGALAERLAWEKRLREAEAEQRRKDAEKQKQLDEIGAMYEVALEDQLDKSTKIAALEAALAEEASDEPQPYAGPARSCPAAIRRRVSNALDAVGR